MCEQVSELASDMPNSTRVYAALREEILTGLRREGARLTENEIADRFGVSRTPVREALLRLQVERLIQVDGSQGTVVRPVSLREIEETYQLREVLEGLAARLAADRATDWDLSRMHGILRRMEEHREQRDWMAWSKANWLFHDSIFEAGGNRRLRMANGELVDLVRRFFRMAEAADGMADRALHEHTEIVRSIEARDPDAAARSAALHVAAAGILTMQQIRSARESAVEGNFSATAVVRT